MDHEIDSGRADQWEMVMPLVSAMYGEFKELSKKRADAPVSTGKIAVVNRILNKCREILIDEPSLELLDKLDADSVPQNSDVVLLLSQYVAALKSFQAKYSSSFGGIYEWRYVDEDDAEDIEDDDQQDDVDDDE